tara:strand:+ start:428 stop:1141 length:714 start_codon:yes stop_codon:yes gene_type:complete
MQLIVLAAGKGTRLPENLRLYPKCLVKIGDKSILEHNLPFYSLFKKKIIVTGFNSKKIKKFIIDNKFREVKNKYYNNTNMVYSAFCPAKNICSDVVICYSDIIFDHNIFRNLRSKSNLIILKKNWLKIWRGRMNFDKIKYDAEDVIIKKNKIIKIGERIEKKLPKFQYMGIIKLRYKSYKKLEKFFLKLNNNKLDFTSFLNLAIQNKITYFKPLITSKKWFEIDTFKDIKFTEKNLW